MAYYNVPSGQSLQLEFVLPDGNTGIFPQAHVYNQANVEVAGSPFNLTHSALGRYVNNSVSLPDGRYYAVFIPYTDAGHTTIATKYGRMSDNYDVNGRDAAISSLQSDIAAIKVITDQITFTSGNVNSDAQVVSDKIDYALSSSARTTLVGDIWNAARSSYMALGSFGEALQGVLSVARADNLDNLDVLVSTRLSTIGATVNTNTLLAEHTQTQSDISALSDKVDPVDFADGIWNAARGSYTALGSFGEALQGIITSARAGNLDNLDVLVSTRLSTTDATTNTNTLLTQHTQTQGDIAAVSDKVDPADFANGVWNAARSSYMTVGSFGESLQGVLSPTRAALLDSLVNLDTTITSRATQTSVNNVPGLVWDENLPSHQIADSTGEALEVARAGNNPVDIAQETWKQLTGDNNDPGSFGEAVNRTAANTDDVKAKTDQLNFDGLRIRAVAEVVTDKTDYFLDPSEHNAISDDVWDETLAAHQTAGSTGEALANAATTSDPSATAAAVWEALAINHTTAGSFGLLTQLTKTNTDTIIASLNNGTYGLDALRLEINASEAAIIAEVNNNEVKIDAIIPAIDAQTTTLTDEINENEVKIDNLSTQLTNTEANIIAEVDENEAKLDQVLAGQDELKDSATLVTDAPSSLQRPTAGTKDYKIFAGTYKTTGQVNADAPPTITVRRLDTNTIVQGPAAMANIGTGQYEFVWSISAATDLYAASIEVSATIGGEVLTTWQLTEIMSFQDSLDSIETTVGSIAITTTQNNDLLTHPTYGLEQIKLGEDTIITEIDQNQVLIEGVKIKTDNLPADPASTTDTLATNALVNSKPDLVDIDNSLAFQTTQIKGVSNIDNTQLSTQITSATQDLLPVNDPRLDFLDAAVSSRSTLTAVDVWTYVDRTLTSGGSDFDINDAQLVWEVLTSAVIPTGSYGELIKTNLDATVSSRATAQQVSDELTGVAQEATLNNQTSTLLAQHTQTQSDVADVKSDTDAIKFKTDNLPADPAANSTVVSEGNLTRADIADTDIKVDAIKAKTDNLPVDPATESSVQAIPTNPALSTDPRLANLDIAVSTRSSLDINDFSDFPRNVDLQTTEDNIIAEVDQNEVKIDAVKVDTAAIKAKTDNLPVDPASSTDVTNSTNTIVAAIPDISDTADAVWDAQTSNHAAPGSFGEQSTETKATSDLILTGQADLATSQEVEDASTPQYRNRISTVLDNVASTQKIIAWADLDGQRQTGTANAIVTVKDKDGAVVWTASEATPSADGIFTFENSIAALTPGDNYYVVVEIDVDGSKRISHEPFFTV
jgi:hypothetical protein